MVISDKISKGVKLPTQTVLIYGLGHGLYKGPMLVSQANAQE